LLLVADREDRAVEHARAGADEELGRERADDAPLVRARVLRLVDQHVIDATVEFVVHPGGIDSLKEREGPLDQIVVVEQAAPILLGLVADHDGVRDGDQRPRAVAADHGPASFDEPGDALALRLQVARQRRVEGLDRLGDDALAQLAGAGDEQTAVDVGAFLAARLQRRSQARRPVVVVLGPCANVSAAAAQRADGRNGPSVVSASTRSMVSAGVMPSVPHSPAIAASMLPA